MSELAFQTLSPERIVSAVLTQLNHEQIADATASFAAVFVLKITALDWSFQINIVSLSSSRKHGSFMQITRCKLIKYSRSAIM